MLSGAAVGSAAPIVGRLAQPGIAAALIGYRDGAVVGELTFDPVARTKGHNVTVPVGSGYDVLVGCGRASCADRAAARRMNLTCPLDRGL